MKYNYSRMFQWIYYIFKTRNSAKMAATTVGSRKKMKTQETGDNSFNISGNCSRLLGTRLLCPTKLVIPLVCLSWISTVGANSVRVSLGGSLQQNNTYFNLTCSYPNLIPSGSGLKVDYLAWSVSVDKTAQIMVYNEDLDPQYTVPADFKKRLDFNNVTDLKHTMTLLKVTPCDAGTYICKVFNNKSPPPPGRVDLSEDATDIFKDSGFVEIRHEGEICGDNITVGEENLTLTCVGRYYGAAPLLGMEVEEGYVIIKDQAINKTEYVDATCSTEYATLFNITIADQTSGRLTCYDKNDNTTRASVTVKIDKSLTDKTPTQFGLSGAEIAGIVIGTIGLAGALLLIVVFVAKKKLQGTFCMLTLRSRSSSRVTPDGMDFPDQDKNRPSIACVSQVDANTENGSSSKPHKDKAKPAFYPRLSSSLDRGYYTKKASHPPEIAVVRPQKASPAQTNIFLPPVEINQPSSARQLPAGPGGKGMLPPLEMDENGSLQKPRKKKKKRKALEKRTDSNKMGEPENPDYKM